MAFSLFRAGFRVVGGRIDTVSVTQLLATAGPGAIGTVRPMVSEHQVHELDPADVFLDTEAIAVRYGIGTTKAKELVRSGLLPSSVVPGMVRIPLAALRAWELGASLADTPADPCRRIEQITVVAPPATRAAGRPARKAA